MTIINYQVDISHRLLWIWSIASSVLGKYALSRFLFDVRCVCSECKATAATVAALLSSHKHLSRGGFCFIRNYLMSHFCNWGIFFRNLLTTGIPATGGISINRGWLTRPVRQQHFNEHKLARLYLSCVLSVFPTSHFALCSHMPL